MKRLFLIAVLLAGLALSGCAAVLVGGLIMKSSKSKGQKQEFLSNLQQVNLEREKAGLQPLNECIEMYHFDPGWAYEKPHCRKTIDSLKKAGIEPDSTAVNVGK
jgi:hypothetical protein